MSYESIDLSVLAERLIAARKAAGIKQEEAAKHLDMSRPTFIAIEKATRRAKPEELVKLSELYNEPLNKLLRKSAPPQQLRPHLRSQLEATASGQDSLESAQAKLWQFIDDYQYLERLVGAESRTSFPPEVKLPATSVERFAEHCAIEERARLKLGDQPIHKLRKVLEEEVGVRIFMDGFASNLAGMYVFVPEFGHCIMINRKHPAPRRRWTIAHEYGHFLADRNTPGVDFIRSPMQRKSASERFADGFAAAFLMPESGVQRRFYDEVNRTGDFKVADLCRMADFYAVSLPAMTLRLEALTLLPRGSWEQIQSEGVSVSKLRVEAGLDAVPEQESLEQYPTRYRQLAIQAFKEEKLSHGQLAELLRCTPQQASEAIEESSRTTIENESGDFVVSLQLTKSLLSGHQD